MKKNDKAGIRVDYATNTIILYRGFAEKAKNPLSEEFAILSKYIKELPGFTVQVRSKIKKNESQEHYKGLTYEYIRDYINLHEPKDKVNEVITELDNLIHISKCHSKRYPVIKNWFLEKYPEVKNFGISEKDLKKSQEQSGESPEAKESEANSGELQEQTEEIIMAEEEPLVA